MNITTSKRDLARLTGRMSAIAERKSTMPALANVLLHAERATLIATSTDLYQSLIGSIPCETTTQGSIAVPASDLVERVKMMPDGPISLTMKDSSLVLKAVGTARKYTMRTMDAGDYPPIQRVTDDAPRMAIEVATLSALLSHTHFAISTDETRAHLNSGLLEWDGDTVKMVSTDGHRLALASRKVEGQRPPSSMLLPLKAIQELRRICDDAYSAPRAEGEAAPSLTIATAGPCAFFLYGGTTFGVKLVDATFPPYAQVIPKTTDHVARVPRAQLVDALKAVSIAASEKTGGIKLSFTKGKLLLSSGSPDGGDGTDELPCEYSGPNKSIGCKASYLTDPLGVLSCEEVDIGTSAELDPITVRIVGDSPLAFVAVIMPMRLGQ